MRILPALLIFCASPSCAQEHSFKPTAGYVPDELTAVAVAVAVLKPIYGSSRIQQQQPFRAVLQGDEWHVFGALPAGYKGGVAEVWLSKNDGGIRRVIHGK